MKAFGIVAGLLGAAGWIAFETWTAMDHVEISVHGYIALALGALLTVALGTGLMFLVFYSSRRGYDGPEGSDRNHPP